MEAVTGPVMPDRLGTIVIGAGPAGLFCALHACRGNNRVLLLEKNGSAGRKLLLSGSGQCNFTHSGDMGEFTNHYGEAANFVKPALFAFTNMDLCSFLAENGVRTIARDDGKMFPASMNARDVLLALLRSCEISGAGVRYESAVTSVTIDGAGFRVETRDDAFRSDSLVIAAGGMSYPDTGSNGDGFTIAGSLGHTVTGITPALAPIIAGAPFPGELAGVSLKDAGIIVNRSGRRAASGRGDVLFTGNGLSGPGILDLSRSIRDADVLSLSLTGMSSGDVETRLIAALQEGGKKTVRNILKTLGIPERLADTVLELAGTDPARKGGEVSRTERMRILGFITGFPVTVEKKGGFPVAMATAGGVHRDEIDRHSMRSRLVANLYFAGEVIDVDGDTGGYNLQWAFSSGRAAAKAILGTSQK